MTKRWTLHTFDVEKSKALQAALKIHPILCNLLVQRGIETFEKAKQFFRPQLSDLHDPFLMKDMHHAVERIATAIQSNEKILVYGDYDVDGACSTTLMVTLLRELHTSARSQVWLATDDASGQPVALKVPAQDLRADAQAIDRFLLEEWVARRIDHPHVLKPAGGTERERPRQHLFVARKALRERLGGSLFREYTSND